MWGAETPALRKLAMRVLSKVTLSLTRLTAFKPCKAVSQTLHGCRCPVLVPVSATGAMIICTTNVLTASAVPSAAGWSTTSPTGDFSGLNS